MYVTRMDYGKTLGTIYDDEPIGLQDEQENDETTAARSREKTRTYESLHFRNDAIDYTTTT